jgi:hypothetical protein
VNRLQKFQEILAQYRKHGWRLARVLMSGEALAQSAAGAEPGAGEAPQFEGTAVEEAEFDAMWFTRPAQGGREAWELRLVTEQPYALFELFEPDEAEEERAEVRREMEARLRDYATGKTTGEEE